MPVRATCGKGVIYFVESNRVYSEAFGLGGLTDGRRLDVLSMAFEAEVTLALLL